jgi:hypothetical protein
MDQPRSYSKGTIVKKIALSLVTLSALGLAACGSNTPTATNNLAADTQNVIDQANSDIANAQATATNALDAMEGATQNAADAAGAAVSNAADAAQNTAR